MDDSNDAFKAAKRVIEMVKNGKGANEDENSKITTKVVAFHSIMHNAFSQGLIIPIPSPFGSYYMIPSLDYQKLEQEYREHGKRILSKVKEMFDKENLPIETRLIVDHTPAEYISKVKKEENFDLVALGCKGEHSRVEELLIGNVAFEILNNVDTDLLIVR